MTATLPPDVQSVFDRFITTEFTTVDKRGQPITWPVTPYYTPGDPCVSVTTGLGYPKKADEARANPKVALLFSDPTGCGLEGTPQVLVQGVADVDDRDLDANLDRYARESREKLPAIQRYLPPAPFRRAFAWYFKRIYVHVRPERVYVWEGGDPAREPRLFDVHMEEVRSGHDEEPDVPLPGVEGGEPAWDERLRELGQRYVTAVVTLVAPDGFPFSLRLPISVDHEARLVRLGKGVVGVPAQPGLACITAHDHHPQMLWQRNFQVRGDLIEDEDGWALRPHRLVGGFELPPGSLIGKWRANARDIPRYRRKAKAELRRRGG